MRALLVGICVELGVLAAPALATAATPRISLGAIQGEKGSSVSSQLQSALCTTFECVPRSEVVTKGKVDFAKMRARGVSAFLLGGVSTKGSAPKLWLALLTTSDHPSRTWSMLLWSGGRVARPALDSFVESLRAQLAGDSGVPVAAPARAAGASNAAAGVGGAAPGTLLAPARIAVGAIQGDPSSQVSGPLRAEICGRLECVKRSQVMTHGHVDLAKMGARGAGGFLFGSVVSKGGARVLWLALITTSEQPTSTWSLPLNAKGVLPRASLKATTAEVVDLLALREVKAEVSAAVTPEPPIAPPAGSPAAAAAPAAEVTAAAVVATETAVVAADASVAAAASAPQAALAAPAAAEPVAASPAPASAAAPPAPPPPAAEAAKPEGHRTEGLIPGILIGPKVTATVLFPPNVMVGAELKVVGYVGASFEYGVFPRNSTVSDYALGIQTWSAGLRAYPFRGTFFVGAVLGSYALTGTQTVGGETSTLSVKSMYLGPQIGWKWDFDFGLFLGLNLGYGFSLNYTSSVTGVAGGSLQTAKDNADKYLKTGVPLFTLLELGWLF